VTSRPGGATLPEARGAPGTPQPPRDGDGHGDPHRVLPDLKLQATGCGSRSRHQGPTRHRCERHPRRAGLLRGDRRRAEDLLQARPRALPHRGWDPRRAV